MSLFASNQSKAEKGPARCGTVDTLVAEPELLAPSTASSSAPNKSTPEPVTPITTNNKTVQHPDWNRCRGTSDVMSYPEGFPRLAAQQVYVHGGGMHRGFAFAGEYVTLYWVHRTAVLEQQLLHFCHKHPDVAKRLSAGQRNENGKASEVEEEYDLIIEQLTEAYDKTTALMLRQRDMKTLLSAHPAESRGMYNFLATQGMEDPDVFQPAYAPEDFVSTAPHLAHLPIRNLMYSRFGQWLREKLPAHWVREDIGAIPLSLTALNLAFRVLQIIFGASLVLVPTGILFLGNLSVGACFGVVVFSVFLCLAVMVGSGADPAVQLGVVCAYSAVLMTFLAQLGIQP